MNSYSEYIAERFVNALPTDSDIKLKFKDQVWQLLKDSYKDIGGIKGSGFKDADDMLNIPMWKLVVNDGKVEAVVMYKDKNGRKSVAMGSTGSDYANKHVASIISTDFKRAFGEKSKKSLGATMKATPWSVLEPFMLKPKVVVKLLRNKWVRAVSGMDNDEIPEDGLLTLSKYPQLRDYGYIREIGGVLVFKVAIGTPNMKIT